MNEVSGQRSACDLFGGKESVAGKIVSVLRSQASSKEYFGDSLEGGNALEVLASIPKSKLTRFFFLNEISSNQIFPDLNWEGLDPFWTAEMEKSGARGMVGDNGHLAPTEIAVRMFIQQRTLTELCAPSPVRSEQEARKLDEYRERYKSAVR